MGIYTQTEIEDKLRGEDLNLWLDLWHTEQGPAKPGALELIAAAIPFPTDRKLRALDVGCGPGDAGRAVHSRFSKAEIDFVDRDLFFVSLCAAVNRRDGIPGRTLARDLSDPDWLRDLPGDYDVVVAVNALHWFNVTEGAQLIRDIFQTLRSGGVFLFMEPVAAESRFAVGFNAWRKEQPSQHKHENWVRFWSRVNTLLGYDHGGYLGGPPPDDHDRIGDSLSVMRWVDLLRGVGFESIDILLRDPEKVVLASVKA